MEAILKMLEENIDRLRTLLVRAIPDIPAERSCSCGDAVTGPT